MLQRLKLRTLVSTCLAFALMLTAPGSALAFSGGLHEYAAEQACTLLTSEMYDIRPDREVPLFPQLLEQGWWFVGADPSETDEGMWDTERNWIVGNSSSADYYEPVYDGYTNETLTYTHFWEAEEGLRGDTEGTYKNAWEKAEILWQRACNNWWAGGSLDGTAFAELGYVVHLTTDQGQPAHVHDDLHGPGNLDSLEEATSREWAAANFVWMPVPIGVTGPSEVMFPRKSNAQILNEIYASGFYNEELATEGMDDGDPLLATEDSTYNDQQLFWIFYNVNKTAAFFASDGAEGHADDAIGWLNGYSAFPPAWWHLTGDDSDNDWSWDELDNNEDACPLPPEQRTSMLCTDDTCDCDGDLTIIARKGYGTAFRAVPAVIDLFRRTVDNVAPTTVASRTREDGQEYLGGWNNSHVTVHLESAADAGRATQYGTMRASGVWRKWGTVDGARSDDLFDPYWHIDEDGIHEVKLLSTDYCGNTENTVFSVYVDTTPPEITFPELRPNYLTSQTFEVAWAATDAMSGVEATWAELDGEPVLPGQLCDLSELAGQHILTAHARDVAGNVAVRDYLFEVWVDTATDVRPTQINTKTNGEGMMVSVEFPAPYDVGAVDVVTCRLRVGGTIDLHEQFPVMGGLTTLEGELLTGVADRDKDGLPERSIRFSKGEFAGAVAGQTGDISAVVWGGPLPNGTPQFIGPVTVPVFTPPAK